MAIRKENYVRFLVSQGSIMFLWPRYASLIKVHVVLRASPHIDMELSGRKCPETTGVSIACQSGKESFATYETARSNPLSRTWLELPQVGSDIIVSYHAYHGDICVGFGLVKLYDCDSREM